MATHTHKQQSEAIANQMATRNSKRLAIIRRNMGEKWVCHPANHVTKRDHGKGASQ